VSSVITEREALILGSPPRLTPLPFDEVSAEALEVATALRNAASKTNRQIAASEIPEMLMTLLRHPSLFRRVSELSVELLRNGALKPRDRELAILRTAWLCLAPYEWGEHVRMAKREGITSEEIDRVIAGSAANGWADHERAILSAAEELHRSAMISDATWAQLATRLDDRQLFELSILIGQFTSIAYMQNTLRLKLDIGNPGLSAR
jgi:alkylhydroperoxidase family enzyme